MSVENLSPAAYRIFIKTLLRKQALSLSECTFSLTRTFPRFKLHLGASCPNSACFISPHVAFSRIFVILSTRKNIPSGFVTSLASASIFFQSFHQPSSPFMPRSYRLPVFCINSYNTYIIRPHSFINPMQNPSFNRSGNPAPARPCEAPPTQAACMRGVRGPARRMETSPAPGSLWFLSPAGRNSHVRRRAKLPSSSTLPPSVCRLPPKQKKNDLPSLDRSSQSYNPLATLQPLTAFSCSCTYSVVRIFFTVPSTSSSVVLWLV